MFPVFSLMIREFEIGEGFASDRIIQRTGTQRRQTPRISRVRNDRHVSGAIYGRMRVFRPSSISGNELLAYGWVAFAPLFALRSTRSWL
jgi:hypothetical protein